MNKPSTAALLFGLLVGAGPIGAETAPDVAWTRQLGTSGYESSYGVAVDSAGNAYISGSTNGSLGGPNAGGSDAFVARYNADGSLIWTRQIGTSGRDVSNGVAVDSAGNAYITGSTDGNLGGPNAGESDAFLARYNADSSLAWTRQLGTSGYESSHGVAVDSAGNAYISGSTNGSLGGPNAGESDAFLARYNADGSLAWTRQLGTSSGDGVWGDVGVAVDSAGNAYITGSTFGSLGGPNAAYEDVFLARYDADGSLAWTRQLGTSSGDWSSGVAVDSAGNAYISGSTNGSLDGPNAGSEDVFLARYDADGSLAWTRQLGTSSSDGDTFGPRGAVAVDSAGNAYISAFTGGSLGGPNAGSYDAFSARYNADGSLAWTRQLGSSGFDWSDGVAVDSAGNAYISGSTTGNLGGPNAGNSDAFLAKFDATEVPKAQNPRVLGVSTLRIPAVERVGVWDGDNFDNSTAINGEGNVHVIVHGWGRGQEGVKDQKAWEAETGFGDWMNEMAGAIQEADPEASVLAFNWLDQSATDSRLRSARISQSQTTNMSKELSLALQVLLADRASGQVNLIGHSHGAKVATLAARDMEFDGVDVDQLTLLDSPENAADGFGVFMNRLHLILDDLPYWSAPSPAINDTEVVNYFSENGLGKPYDDSDVNVRLKPVHLDSAEAHGYPYEWFTRATDLTSNQGLAWFLDGLPEEDNYYQDWLVEDVLTEPFRDTSREFVLTADNGDSITPEYRSAQLVFDAYTTENTAYAWNEGWRLTEASPAFIDALITIDSEDEVLLLDYEFLAEGDGDQFGVWIDNELYLLVTGSLSDNAETSYIDISGLGPGQHLLTLALHSTGDTNADIYVSDMSILSVPEPSSLALFGIGTLLMTRRRR